MDTITVLNTAVSSLNLGDQIIMDAVDREISKIKTDFDFRLDLSSHAGFNSKYLKSIEKSKFSILGGTNILSSKFSFFARRNQLAVNAYQAQRIRNIILLGTGWGAEKGEVSNFAKWFYRNTLKKNAIHSVRDRMSLEKLNKIGISNVINTGCPTLWDLSVEHCELIPQEKAKTVVSTITDYLQDFNNDKRMLEILVENYNNCYLWLQGTEDLEYIKKFDSNLIDHFVLIPPSLDDYNRFLNENDTDFVGTRLHAGIRAMQKSKRAIILSIDNRAREMGKDFHLNVLERENIGELNELINSSIKTDIHLAHAEINLWREQFK